MKTFFIILSIVAIIAGIQLLDATYKIVELREERDSLTIERDSLKAIDRSDLLTCQSRNRDLISQRTSCIEAFDHNIRKFHWDKEPEMMRIEP